MATKTLKDLFVNQLKDIYYAEKMIYKTLPKLAEATKIPALRDAFTHHREETHEHMARIEQVFEMLKMKPDAKTCEAIKGILAEGDETMEEFTGSPALETGLIAAAEAAEHYEMARYGALVAWAKRLDMPQAAELLNKSMQEEVKADKLLVKIGQQEADQEAA